MNSRVLFVAVLVAAVAYVAAYGDAPAYGGYGGGSAGGAYVSPPSYSPPTDTLTPSPSSVITPVTSGLGGNLTAPGAKNGTNATREFKSAGYTATSASSLLFGGMALVMLMQLLF